MYSDGSPRTQSAGGAADAPTDCSSAPAASMRTAPMAGAVTTDIDGHASETYSVFPKYGGSTDPVFKL